MVFNFLYCFVFTDIEVLNNLESKCPLKIMLWNNGIPVFNVCHI